MDPFGSKALNLPKESISSPLAKDGGGKKIGSVDKQAAVHEEMKRMNQLPANSAYATHRLRVLNKVLQLLSIQELVNELFHTLYEAWLKSLPTYATTRTFGCALHVMPVNTL